MGKGKKKNYKKKSNNSILIYLGMAIVGVILIGIIALNVGGGGGLGGSPTSATLSDGKQVVNIKASAAGYEPNYISAKKGIPLVMNFDVTSDAGCVGGIIIKDFGINKALPIGGQGTIEITPDKLGKFEFSCQMYMSTGSIEVAA